MLVLVTASREPAREEMRRNTNVLSTVEMLKKSHEPPTKCIGCELLVMTRAVRGNLEKPRVVFSQLRPKTCNAEFIRRYITAAFAEEKTQRNRLII